MTKRRIRAIAVLPTLFTLGNLVCGFFAIVVAARIAKPDGVTLDPTEPWNVAVAASLIFLAMAFDALDGQLARLSRTSSEFGAQLDSLADLVTFGVAPAFLLVKMCPKFITDFPTNVHTDQAVWVIAALFAVCVALRLARFNVETSLEDDHMHFSGLPSPAGGAAIASFAFLFYTLRRPDNTFVYAAQVDTVLQLALPFFAVVVALLMVSRIPYPHVTNQLFRGHRSFAHVVALVFALVGIILVRSYAVPVIVCTFVLAGPARLLWFRIVHRTTAQEEPVF